MLVGRRNLLAATASAVTFPFILKTMGTSEAQALVPPPNQAVFDAA